MKPTLAQTFHELTDEMVAAMRVLKRSPHGVTCSDLGSDVVGTAVGYPQQYALAGSSLGRALVKRGFATQDRRQGRTIFALSERGRVVLPTLPR